MVKETCILVIRGRHRGKIRIANGEKGKENFKNLGVSRNGERKVRGKRAKRPKE